MSRRGLGRSQAVAAGEEAGPSGMTFGPDAGAPGGERWASSIGQAQSSGSGSC